MNQILVTEKLYITPEIKRKKKMYKIRFCISIFVICMLFSYYIYAEHDKDKSEAVSKDILAEVNSAQISIQNQRQEDEEVVVDPTTKNIINDVLIIALDADRAEEEETIEQLPNINLQEEDEEQESIVYSADDGTTYTIESTLSIPSLDINYPVIADTSEELLKISLNKYWGPAPNQVGNYCIVGHNYKNGKMFGKLSQMDYGDVAILTDMGNKSRTYEVYDKYIISPDDVACTSQLTGGARELTLITCTNYGTQRLVVKCREI